MDVIGQIVIIANTDLIKQNLVFLKKMVRQASPFCFFHCSNSKWYSAGPWSDPRAH